MNDDLFEYLVATDQVDEFLGLKEENEENEFDISDDNENENDNDEEVIGKWEAVDCVSNIEDFKKNEPYNDLCFKEKDSDY